MKERDTSAHRYEGHRRRLRERFLQVGREGLGDYELLELLLTYALPRRDVKPLAKDLLHHFGDLRGVLDAKVQALCEVSGIQERTACLLTLMKALMTHYLETEAKAKVTISSSRDLHQFLSIRMGGLKEEQFCVLYLDSQNHLLSLETLQRGTINQAIVYPRQVVEHALERKAACLILVHNHPSGVLKPSEADIRLTKAICQAARTLDLVVHDHVIVGDGQLFSFQEAGIMAMM